MKQEEIKSPENKVYSKPALLNDTPMHYCPGCSHGVVHKLVAEVIEEMGAEHIAIGVAPVGCAVFAYNYIDIDWIEAAHGRAPACPVFYCICNALRGKGRTVLRQKTAYQCGIARCPP